MKNVFFGSTSTEFFLSGLLQPSDWKLQYLPNSTRDIRHLASGNWGLLLEVFALGNPARFWGAEAWCLSTQPHHIPWQSSSEAQEAEPECSDACGCNVDVKGWLPQCSCFYYWNMRLQITQPQYPEPFSHVCVFLGVCCLGLFWRLCLAMFAAASLCAFLPDPILILHNTGCSPPPLMYTYHLF